MELRLRLGDPSSSFELAEKPHHSPSISPQPLDFCLGFSSICRVEEEDEEREKRENSSLLQLDLRQSGCGVELEDGGERACSRASDDDDQNIGSASRKKLRLSREQSAFLEESFKEHHTLYPKQKLELARRLDLRPRQVEVWFQNRRARTKLKQTEVDCEYLKKCCETLSEENRKLQKELQDLRALKTTDSLYMHLPATTLTICPSCERVAGAAAMKSGEEPSLKASGFSFARHPTRDFTN